MRWPPSSTGMTRFRCLKEMNLGCMSCYPWKMNSILWLKHCSANLSTSHTNQEHMYSWCHKSLTMSILTSTNGTFCTPRMLTTPHNHGWKLSDEGLVQDICKIDNKVMKIEWNGKHGIFNGRLQRCFFETKMHLHHSIIACCQCLRMVCLVTSSCVWSTVGGVGVTGPCIVWVVVP